MNILLWVKVMCCISWSRRNHVDLIYCSNFIDVATIKCSVGRTLGGEVYWGSQFLVIVHCKGRILRQVINYIISTVKSRERMHIHMRSAQLTVSALTQPKTQT